MSNATDRISYALSKQVPDMAHGFTISTNYGDLTIAAADALEFAALADKLLTRQYLAAINGEKKP